jgi:hypothetical protein
LPRAAAHVPDRRNPTASVAAPKTIGTRAPARRQAGRAGVHRGAHCVGVPKVAGNRQHDHQAVQHRVVRRSGKVPAPGRQGDRGDGVTAQCGACGRRIQGEDKGQCRKAGEQGVQRTQPGDCEGGAQEQSAKGLEMPVSLQLTREQAECCDLEALFDATCEARRARMSQAAAPGTAMRSRWRLPRAPAGR